MAHRCKAARERKAKEAHMAVELVDVRIKAT